MDNTIYSDIEKDKILDLGKVESDLLQSIVFDNIKYKSEDVIVRPGIGEDCAVLSTEGNHAVMSTDPITASVKDIGRIAIHITCNDIASNGVRPVGIMLAIMLPYGTSQGELETIMRQAGETAEKLKVDIIGGHTEVTKAVNKPVIVSTAIGKTEVYREDIPEVGDVILMTKYAGIEGTGIIIGDFERKCREVLSDDEIRQGRLLLDRVSVVEEGIIIGREGFCKMHDVTEGGVLGAVWETCSLIGLGCTVKEKSIPVLEITEKISRIFKIDCLRLISSGSNDPYALRRATQGVVRILDKFGWHIALDELIEQLYALQFDSLTYSNKEQVLDFFRARIEKMMDNDIPKDIVTAVLNSSTFVVRDLVEVAALLAEKAQENSFKPAVESLARVFNLAEKAEAVSVVNESLFENEEEKELHTAIEHLTLSDDLAGNIEQLFALSPVIDAFFDNTMVMAEDEVIRANRLALLASLTTKAKKVAQFNQINTK